MDGNKSLKNIDFIDPKLKSAALKYFVEALTTSTGSETSLTAILGEITTPSTIGHISNNAVTVAPVQIDATSNPCKKCIITANENNTGWIRVGGSSLTVTTGILIYAGESIELDIDNSNKIYVAAEVADEDVSAIYLT